MCVGGDAQTGLEHMAGYQDLAIKAFRQQEVHVSIMSGCIAVNHWLVQIFKLVQTVSPAHPAPHSLPARMRSAMQLHFNPYPLMGCHSSQWQPQVC